MSACSSSRSKTSRRWPSPSPSWANPSGMPPGLMRVSTRSTRRNSPTSSPGSEDCGRKNGAAFRSPSRRSTSWPASKESRERTTVVSDFLAGEPLAARLRLGCNDGLRVWLNGREVLSHHEHRPADPRVSADECDVDFAEGWNRLTVKMAQCSPRRFLSVTVRDREGRPLPGLTNSQPRREVRKVMRCPAALKALPHSPQENKLLGVYHSYLMGILP